MCGGGSKDSLGMLVQAFPKRVVRRRPTVWFGSVTRQSHVVCRRGLKNDGVIDVIALVVLFVAVVSNTMESMM